MKKWIVCCLLMVTLAACGPQTGGEQVSPTEVSVNEDAPIFSVEVTGTVEATLSSPEDMIRFWSDNSETTSPMTTLWIGDGENNSMNIIFFGEDLPESGTYSITDYPYEAVTPGRVYADFMSLTSFQPSDSVSGTITIEREDETYSGTFNFHVTGAQAGQTATATGSFTNFELQRNT